MTTIKLLDKDNASLRRYRFESSVRGQLTWVKKRCEDKGIKVTIMGNSMYMYAKRKIEEFYEIVKQSEKIYSERVTSLSTSKDSITYTKNSKLVCVVIIPKKKIYVHTDRLEDMVEMQYEGKIPDIKYQIICNTYREMEEKLLKNENIFI